MKTASLILMLSLTAAAALVATACGTPAARCLPSDCPNGCCDSAGVCQPGVLETACGQSGSACGVCTAGQFCQTGICISGNTGGNDGGGGGQDAGTDGGPGGQDGGAGDGGTGDAGTGDAGTGDAGTLDGGGGGYTAIAFCKDLEEAYCGLYARCGVVSSKSNCLSEKLFDFEDGCSSVLAPSVKDGRLVLDATAAPACFAHFENNYPCDFGTNPFIENASCMQALAGQGGAGAECYEFVDCTPDKYCYLSNCPGSCFPRAGQNQLADSSEACAAGLYYYYANSTCRSPVAAGGNCAPLAEGVKQTCVSGYYCSSSFTCSASKAAGGTCPNYDECQAGLRCDSGICQAYRTLGQACTAYACTYDLTCNTAVYNGPGTCAQRGDVGAGCWFSYGDCKTHLTCFGANPSTNTKGVCGPPRTQGQACAASDQCVDGLYCAPAGSCQPKKTAGQACTSGDECVSWDCSSGVCGASTSNACVDPTP
jgi:hypothetical protein